MAENERKVIEEIESIIEEHFENYSNPHETLHRIALALRVAGYSRLASPQRPITG